jgi:hypothetical protein
MNGGLAGAAGTLTILSSTIADNDAAVSGDGLANVPFNGSATAEYTNTLFARNGGAGGASCANLLGTLVSHGHNLEDGNTCQLTQPGDLPATPVALGLLQNNGGPTETHALLPLSAGIDAGDNAACASAPVGGVDQRGVARPQGIVCDIGSYESQWPAASWRLNTSFAMTDGSRGSRSFVLLSDGRFVDQEGLAGGWGPFGTGLALLYDAGVECSGAWLGRFSSGTSLTGSIVCRDGSGMRGVWRGTLTAP